MAYAGPRRLNSVEKCPHLGKEILINRLTQACASIVLDCTSARGEASGGVPLRGGFTQLDRDSTTQCVAVF